LENFQVAIIADSWGGIEENILADGAHFQQSDLAEPRPLPNNARLIVVSAVFVPL